MNLSDYISLTLNEIAEGVKRVNESYETTNGSHVLTGTPQDVNQIPHTFKKEDGHLIRKPIINVALRVGVELEESKGSNNKIGGSLKVVSIDHESTKKGEKRSTHEVSFELPLILP